MKQVSLYLLIKNVLIIYGGLNVMENEVKKVVFIEEKTYQQMKKKMGKTNNYFSEKEFERLGEIQAKLI